MFKDIYSAMKGAGQGFLLKPFCPTVKNSLGIGPVTRFMSQNPQASLKEFKTFKRNKIRKVGSG